MSNNISLNQAAAMTKLYREQRDNILKDEYQGQNLLLTCETFDRSAFAALIDDPQCVKIRVYFGMTENLQVRAIAVAVNDNDEDILPSDWVDPTEKIAEDGVTCPNTCPPSSPLSE